MQSNNRLLRSLAPADHQALARHMRPMSFKQGVVLYEPHDRVDWVYFPEEGLVSLLSVMISGLAVETAVVGQEGGVGFRLKPMSRRSTPALAAQNRRQPYRTEPRRGAPDLGLPDPSFASTASGLVVAGMPGPNWRKSGPPPQAGFPRRHARGPAFNSLAGGKRVEG